MNKDKKINRAQQLANKYANQKMPGINIEIHDVLIKYISTQKDLAEIIAQIDKLIGQQIGLAYGLGWVQGIQKRTLYRANGEELT